MVPKYLKWWEWAGPPVKGVYQAPIHNLTSMHYVCNIDMVGNPAKDDNPWYPCPLFNEFLHDNPLPKELQHLDLNLYNVRRDTFKGSVTALLKYDLPEGEPILDIPIVRAAINDVKRDYSSLEGKGRIKQLAEVRINPQGSSGVAFKRMKLDHRVDVIAQEPGMLEWFWENAHLLDLPVLWKEFGKVELLKVGKPIRGISNPPVDFHMSSAAMNQHTNELASEYGAKVVDQPFGPGMSLQGGGLNRYVEWLAAELGKITSSDADRWDSRIRRLFMMIIIELRYYFWDKKGMSTEEWFQRQNYYYAQKIFTYLVASNGQVFMKMFGNPSGQDSTTYDNTWIHNFVKYYIFRKNTGIGADPNGYAIMKRHYRFKLYGDDNNEKVLPPYDQYFTFERRDAAYKELGMILSPDKDVESDSPTGHVWLGKTIRYDAESCAWVGEVNSNKILCSLKNLESQNMETEIVYMRAIALMVEATWTEPLQAYMRKYVHMLYERQNKLAVERGDLDKWFIAVPPLEMCKNFWLGRESSIPTEVKDFLNECIHVQHEYEHRYD